MGENRDLVAKRAVISGEFAIDLAQLRGKLIWVDIAYARHFYPSWPALRLSRGEQKLRLGVSHRRVERVEPVGRVKLLGELPHEAHRHQRDRRRGAGAL